MVNVENVQDWLSARFICPHCDDVGCPYCERPEQLPTIGRRPYPIDELMFDKYYEQIDGTRQGFGNHFWLSYEDDTTYCFKTIGRDIYYLY